MNKDFTPGKKIPDNSNVGVIKTEADHPTIGAVA
jgi:hypothetical protein